MATAAPNRIASGVSLTASYTTLVTNFDVSHYDEVTLLFDVTANTATSLSARILAQDNYAIVKNASGSLSDDVVTRTLVGNERFAVRVDTSSLYTLTVQALGNTASVDLYVLREGTGTVQPNRPSQSVV